MNWNNGGNGDNMDPVVAAAAAAGGGGGGAGGGEMDAFSFDDSDRFEDDSVCSWISEPESVVNNWRGWRKPSLAAASLPAGGAPLLYVPPNGPSAPGKKK